MVELYMNSLDLVCMNLSVNIMMTYQDFRFKGKVFIIKPIKKGVSTIALSLKIM